MEQWPLVVGDGVLLVVALAGGVVTLVRSRAVGGTRAALAGAACFVLVLAMVFDLVWWLAVEPTSNTGVAVTMILTAIGVGLLIGATNAGSAAAREARHARDERQTHPAHPPAAPVPGYQQPIANGGPPVQQPFQTAGGWTPPQQAHPNDWNVQSGVWSIPRGTFDGPPPDQR